MVRMGWVGVGGGKLEDCIGLGKRVRMENEKQSKCMKMR
jgi:hypothetical protein